MKLYIVRGVKLMRLILFLYIILLSMHVSYSQTVSDVIGKDKQNNVESADVTVFAFAYSLFKESDKVLLPMIEDPSNAMRESCKMITPRARQWIYMNAVLHYNRILDDVTVLQKHLSVANKMEVGPVGDKIAKALRERRAIIESARALDLSADVVMERLELNDNFIDKMLIEAGNYVASSAFNTFREVDITEIKSVSGNIRNLLKNNCKKNPIDKESYIEAYIE